jgi:hypothetical protein
LNLVFFTSSAPRSDGNHGWTEESELYHSMDRGSPDLVLCNLNDEDPPQDGTLRAFIPTGDPPLLIRLPFSSCSALPIDTHQRLDRSDRSNPYR